jgi:hypothetical protein
MKKYTFILLFLAVYANSFAQTILNQFPLELKRSSEYFQILNGENEQKEYFAYITDKKKCTLLKYNSALFFKDSLSISRPDNEYDFMAGMTFSNKGNPQVYWASNDYKKIKLIDFDLENHSTSYLDYENDFNREKIIDAFTADNVFFILSITTDNKLRFTHFSNSGKNEQVIDLGTNNTENGNSVDNNLLSSIFDFGLTKIETNLFTPLYIATAKVKRYLSGSKYVLSFDLNNQTSLLTINLNDFSVAKEAFPYDNLGKNSGSNSFLHNDVLYQLTVNKNALSLNAIDLNTKIVLETYRTNANEDIAFKNSPLLLVSENGKSRVLKKTSKMLSKIDEESIGLSIYSSPNYNLFTIGGVRQVVSSGNMLLGFGLSLGGAMGGTTVDIGGIIDADQQQSLYFESFFDPNFKHLNTPFRPLYIDALSDFLNQNNPIIYNSYPFQDYIILNYYDKKSNEFVMRKFEDVRD